MDSSVNEKVVSKSESNIEEEGKSTLRYQYSNNSENILQEAIKKLDGEEIVKPMHKVETQFTEKIRKNLNSFTIIVDFITSILNDAGLLFEKQSYTELDKAVGLLRDLKSYLKKLKTHIDNNKNFSVNQKLKYISCSYNNLYHSYSNIKKKIK